MRFKKVAADVHQSPAQLSTDVKADRLNQGCQTRFIMLATYFDPK